jgi:hypothetical protein
MHETAAVVCEVSFVSFSFPFNTLQSVSSVSAGRLSSKRAAYKISLVHLHA